MDGGAKMTPNRLPQVPPERPETETNRSKSAPKVPRSTFRFWGVRVIPAMFSPRAQKRRAQRPGGSFWGPRGGERKFGGALGDPKIDKKTTKIHPGAQLAPKAAPRGPGRPPRLPKGSQKVPKKEPRGGPKGAP